MENFDEAGDGDITRQCVEKDCGKDFVITQSEQDFYARKNFELPKRCKSCREKKKARQQEFEK